MFFVFSLLTSPVPKPTPASVSEEPYKKDNGCKLSSHPLILMSLSHTYTLLLRILLQSDVISSPPPLFLLLHHRRSLISSNFGLSILYFVIGSEDIDLYRGTVSPTGKMPSKVSNVKEREEDWDMDTNGSPVTTFSRQ